MAYRAPPEAWPPREILIETGSVTLRGRLWGYLAWAAWSTAVVTLIARSGAMDSPLPGARLLLATGMPALFALGAIPAMLLAHAVCLREKDRLVLDHEGLSADGARVVRFADPLAVRVVESPGVLALVIQQAGTRIVLFGGIESCLGDSRRWGPHWERLDRADGDQLTSSPTYVVRGSGAAIVAGKVEPSEALSALVQDVLELVARDRVSALAASDRIDVPARKETRPGLRPHGAAPPGWVR